MIKQLFIFKVIKGKPNFGSDHNELRFRSFLQDNEGKEFGIIRKENKRSGAQNRFYWFYLQVIEQETGNNADDLHEYFRRKFLTPKFITVMGKEIKIPRSTTELNKVEFGEYMEKICAETEVPIPNPQEAGFVSNY